MRGASSRFRRSRVQVVDGEHEIAKLDSLFSFHVAALRNDGRTHEGDLFSSDALVLEAETTSSDTSRLTRKTATHYRASKRVNESSVPETSRSARFAFSRAGWNGVARVIFLTEERRVTSTSRCSASSLSFPRLTKFQRLR